MANLHGSRSHGGKWDVLAGAILRDDPARFTNVYRVLLSAARAEGIGKDRLPDFLGLEHGGELALLGQDELQTSALELALQRANRPARRRRRLVGKADGADYPGRGPGRAACVRPECAEQLRPAMRLLRVEPLGVRRQTHAGRRTYQAVERHRTQRAPGSPERPGRLPSHDVAFDTGLLTSAQRC